jgi:hypothetical protein
MGQIVSLLIVNLLCHEQKMSAVTNNDSYDGVIKAEMSGAMYYCCHFNQPRTRFEAEYLCYEAQGPKARLWSMQTPRNYAVVDSFR